jgi:hypothetical protein
MGTPVVTNILKTGAVCWYAPVGESYPDETSVAYGGDWGGNWARVGFTKEPLSWFYEDERHRINVEEELTAVKEVRITEETRLETVLSELTAAYFELARGGDPDNVSEVAAGAGQDGYEELEIGGEVDVEEYAWGFEGRYVDSDGAEFPLRVFVHKATAKLNGELTFSKKEDDYTGVPLMINALADTTQSDGAKLLKIQRVTAEATS